LSKVEIGERGLSAASWLIWLQRYEPTLDLVEEVPLSAGMAVAARMIVGAAAEP